MRDRRLQVKRSINFASRVPLAISVPRLCSEAIASSMSAGVIAWSVVPFQLSVITQIDGVMYEAFEGQASARMARDGMDFRIPVPTGCRDAGKGNVALWAYVILMSAMA
jgi:hypothetical protein